MDDVFEDRVGGRLAAEFDFAGERWVGGDELAGPSDGGGVEVGADEVPAVSLRAEERVDAVGSSADVEEASGGLRRKRLGRVFGEQVGGVVEVVGATRDGRAEKAGGKIPVGDAVVGFEEGAVECFDGVGIGEVEGVAAERVRDKKAF